MPPPPRAPRGAGTFALIDDATNAVREVKVVAPGAPSLSEIFHPALAVKFVPVSDAQAASVRSGWIYNRQTKTFSAPPPPPPVTAGGAAYYVPVSVVRERLEADGVWPAAAAAIAAEPALMLKVLTLTHGLDPNDPSVIGMLNTIGADAERILSPPGVALPPLPPA
jgi:hypothetical protein